MVKHNKIDKSSLDCKALLENNDELVNDVL